MRYYSDTQIHNIVKQLTAKGLFDFCIAKKRFDDSEYIRENYFKNE